MTLGRDSSRFAIARQCSSGRDVGRDWIVDECSFGRLTGRLILNPTLAIPRHIILAAAFNERPLFEPKFWPSETVYNQLAPEERERKLRWVEA
jgi:hypothetical protein